MPQHARGERLPLEVVRVEGEPVAVLLNGKDFACEEETGEQLSRRISWRGFGSLRSQTTLPSSPSSRSEETSFICEATLGFRVSATARLQAWARNCSGAKCGMVKAV